MGDFASRSCRGPVCPVVSHPGSACSIPTQIEVHFNRQVAALPLQPKYSTLVVGSDIRCRSFEVKVRKYVELSPLTTCVRPLDPGYPQGLFGTGRCWIGLFENETLDFVYVIEVFRYLAHDDNLQGLREVFRVLRPGGIFFGTFVNRFSPRA
jgi:SAM-dependent methyltransferase